MIHKINSQIALTEVTLPILRRTLKPLRKHFREHSYDLESLQQEVDLRLAEIVLCGRDGRWTTGEERSDLVISRQVFQILSF
ncbi:hypothetical protein BGX27_003646, partial [Mortierella sp. AM989]